MNHISAFLLRIIAQSIMDRYRFPRFPPAHEAKAVFDLLDAADRCDSRIPIDLPTWWIEINSTGGAA